MARFGIDRGVLYAVYGATPETEDANDRVRRVVSEAATSQSAALSGLQLPIVGLASLNTTGDWPKTKGAELERLRTALSLPEFAGAKLAPPHTCLELDSDAMRDVAAVVAASEKPVLTVHVGTTPFCGSLGKMFGVRACCGREYVDPTLLAPVLTAHPGLKVVLLHSGFDFIADEPEGGVSYLSESIELAQRYPQAYLEISALFAESAAGELKYPGGEAAVGRIKEAGLAGRTIWGSDANWNPGMLGPNLVSALDAMSAAGFTREELCDALVGHSRHLFWPHEDEYVLPELELGGAQTTPHRGDRLRPTDLDRSSTSSSALGVGAAVGGGLLGSAVALLGVTLGRCRLGRASIRK